MMKPTSFFFYTLLATLSLLSCDEGDITDETYTPDTEFYTVKFSGEISGFDAWSEGYYVVLAAYDEESDYSLIQKQLTGLALKEGQLMMVLPNIPAEAKTIELGVVNKLRRRIATFESITISPSEMSTGDTISFTLSSPMNVGQFATIQREIFDGANYNCSMCHGSSNGRANLNLTTGQSYQNLVNVASTRVEGGVRVIPGDALSSVLHDVLAEGNPAGMRYDHGNLVDAVHTRLIDDWINHGASE